MGFVRSPALGGVLAAGRTTGAGWLGALIDDRGRYSLSRLQFLIWMLVVLPLVTGVFVGRLSVNGTDPFGFTIPGEVLGVIGIATASTITAAAIKAHKDSSRPEFVAASKEGGTLGQIVLTEEGPAGDVSVDLTKLQQLAITLLLAFVYVASTVHDFAGHGPRTPVRGPAEITSLPNFGPTFLLLLAASNVGYLAGKLPNRGSVVVEDSPGYTVAERRLDQASHPRLDRKDTIARRKEEHLAASQQQKAAFKAQSDTPEQAVETAPPNEPEPESNGQAATQAATHDP